MHYSDYEQHKLDETFERQIERRERARQIIDEHKRQQPMPKSKIEWLLLHIWADGTQTLMPGQYDNAETAQDYACLYEQMNQGDSYIVMRHVREE